MKKQYITPYSFCCELEVESLLAGSPDRPNGWEGIKGNDDIELIPGFEYEDDGNGDGMNE